MNKDNNALVYVLSKSGRPLDPTRRCGKVRRLLKEGKARVAHREPFTVQLLYETTEFTRDFAMGIDPGYKTVGISVSDEKGEVYASETEIRTDIPKRLMERRELRRGRRSRKLRHRKPRFSNRKKEKGWIAPSLRQKVDSHVKEAQFVCSILPVKEITVEIAAFDIQKIKDPEISGEGYQNGEMRGWHLREFVLHRDGHTCQICGTKKGPFEVHHKEKRPDGGDTPENRVTLCHECHWKLHHGLVKLPESAGKGKSYKAETAMNVTRWRIYNELKDWFDGEVKLTYGAETKHRRIGQGLPKGHATDALVISGNAGAKRLGCCYLRKQVRSHNRQIHRARPIKGHRFRRAQTDHEMFGFRLNDKVLYEGRTCFVAARRKTGYFKLKSLDGSFVKDGVSHKKIKLVEKRKGTLTQRVVR